MLRTAEMIITEEVLPIDSVILKREVTITLLMPDGYNFTEPLNLLLLNHGQPTDALTIKQTLQSLYRANQVKPVIIAIVDTCEQLIKDYGLTNNADEENCTDNKATLYTQFILDELLPQLYMHTAVKAFNTIAVAGFGPGCLAALDIARNHYDIFSKAGMFLLNPLQLHGDNLTNGHANTNHILRRMISESKNKPGLKFWLHAEGQSVTTSGNQNDVDNLKDSFIELVKQLKSKGYTLSTDIQYLEIAGGKHNASGRVKAMSRFLTWAFGKRA